MDQWIIMESIAPSGVVTVCAVPTLAGNDVHDLVDHYNTHDNTQTQNGITYDCRYYVATHAQMLEIMKG